MKLMIASDLHGSRYWCERMLERYRQEEAQRLILLGDLLYHGPRNDLPRDYSPKEVLALLNQHKGEILVVRGNCDSEVDQMVLEFPILADYAVLFLGGRMVYATHGHVHNLEQLPPMQPGDVLLHGHTHLQAMEQVGKIWYLNPGSVALPKGEDQNSYMTYQDGTFLLRDMEGKELGRLALGK